MKLIDSHAHLDDSQFQHDLDSVIRRAGEQHVDYIVSIGQNKISCQETVDLVDKYPNLYAVVGLHPHEAKHASIEFYTWLHQFSDHPRIVAIGEIGLDYHYDNSPREVQKEVFRNLMYTAKNRKLPVVIHTREAEVDTLSILNEFRGDVTGIMHCFSGNRELLYKSLDLGYYISIAGPVTFKKAIELQNLVPLIPDDRLLIETDSPYLAPVPYRGKRNEPAYLVSVAKKIAELKNKPLDEIAALTFNNTKQIFNLSIS